MTRTGQAEAIGTVDYTTSDCGTCHNTGLMICLHPTTEIDSDGDRVCLTCDEIIDGQEQPQQTLCRDCQ